MARIKIRKKKNGEPEWLAQHRIAKQIKVNMSPHPTIEDIWLQGGEI